MPSSKAEKVIKKLKNGSPPKKPKKKLKKPKVTSPPRISKPKKKDPKESSKKSSKPKKRKISTSSETTDASPKKKRKLNSDSPAKKKTEKKVFEIDTKMEEEFPEPLWKTFVHFGTFLRQVRQFDEYDKLIRRIKKYIPKELKPANNKPRIKPIDDDCPKTTPVCVITDVQFCTPRGKQQLEIYKTCLAFRSQNKVKKGEDPDAHVATWTNFDKWLNLDEPGKSSHFFVTLKHPISVGKHSAKILHFQFGYGEEFELKLEKRVGKVKPNTKDIAAETLGRVVEHLSKKKLIMSRNAKFQSYKVKEPFVRCTLGSNSMKCYFLDIGIFLVPKPLTIIELSDIVEIETGTTGARYISVTIKTKNDQLFDLGMIAKDELKPIQAYFIRHQICGFADEVAEQEPSDKPMDWNNYDSEDDDEFDFQAALSKTDVSADFQDGKLDLRKVASDEWKEMQDLKSSGALDADPDVYDEDADSDFDFDDEVQKTDLKKDFKDADRNYDVMVDDKDFKKIIDNSGTALFEEPQGFTADDLSLMKEYADMPSSSEEEDDSEEEEELGEEDKRMLSNENDSDETEPEED